MPSSPHGRLTTLTAVPKVFIETSNTSSTMWMKNIQTVKNILILFFPNSVSYPHVLFIAQVVKRPPGLFRPYFTEKGMVTAVTQMSR